MYILGYIYYSAKQVVRKSKAPTPQRTPFSGAGRASHRVLASLRQWRAQRAAIRQLNALPDRLLRDIGLRRGQIEATVSALIGKTDAQATTGPNIAVTPPRAFEAACY